MDNSTLNLLREARDVVLNYSLNDRFRNLVEKYYARNPLLLYKNRPFIYYIQILSSFSPRFRRYFRQTGFRKIPEFLSTCASDSKELSRLRLFLSSSETERARVITTATPIQSTVIKQAEKVIKDAQIEIDRSVSRRNFAEKIKVFEQELKDPVLRLRLLANKQFTPAEIDIILKNNLHEISSFQDEKQWRQAVDKATNQVIKKQGNLQIKLPAIPRLSVKPGWVATGFSTSIGAALGLGVVGGPAGFLAGGAGGALLPSLIRRGGGEGVLRFSGKVADTSINFFGGLTQITTLISPFKKIKLAFIIGGVLFALVFLTAAGFPQSSSTTGTPISSSPGPIISISPSPSLSTTPTPITPTPQSNIVSCPLSQGSGGSFRFICGTARNPSSNGCAHGNESINPATGRRYYEICQSPPYAACPYTDQLKAAVDIRPQSGNGAGTPVFMPLVEGQRVNWTKVGGPIDLNRGIWGVKLEYETTTTSGKKVRIDLTHLDRAGLNQDNRPITSGTQVGTLKPGVDIDGGGHLHIAVGIDGRWLDAVDEVLLCR